MHQEMAGVNDSLRLAELLAIRFCHDISGPVGTLMGALDMFQEDPASGDEAIGLATDVAAGLARRLRLLRAAWGGAGPALSINDLRGLCEGLPLRHKITLDFGNLSPAGRFSPAAARLVLNVLLLATECLPGGGTILLAGNPAAEVVVRIAGPRAAWPAGFAACMADAAQAWAALDAGEGEASRAVQGPLTALIARNCEMRMSFLLAAGTEGAPPLLLAPDIAAGRA